ncbi:tudor domain-containing protein 3-like [Uloborus diversus]|uniref:tudor domain-containing protein 3-like n=1 Tax=Uloborus diversus TaxID=327109 RepID=UPI00240A716B|nr:tudor domain-containing protein 3-like [Uloborus diversus]
MPYLSKEGLEQCKEGLDRQNVTSIVQKALDMDLREIGDNFLSEDVSRGKLDFITGGGVLQIQKIKNASAPKYEYGSGAPSILRLLLTDGNTYINCLQWGQWKTITMDTPPGTKIYLKPGKIPMQNGFMLLAENQFSVLGGCVAVMVEKWELCRRLASHVRTKEDLDGSGPPPWIPFGKPIIGSKPSKAASNFKSLEQDAKEAKENAIFKQQRMANIAEVSRVKETKAKVFGGGKEVSKPNSFKQEAEPHTHANSSNNFSSYEKTGKQFQDYGFQNKQSPNRTGRYQNDDKFNKNFKNDWSNDESQRTRNASATLNLGQFITKDKRTDQRNKNNGSFQNNRNPSNFQAKSDYSFNENQDGMNSSKKFSKNSYLSENPKPSEVGSNRYLNENKEFDFEAFTDRVSQVKLHGYDSRSEKMNFVPGKPFLKRGVEVMAKYWEDNKFYRAVIHAVGDEGKTCVVHFMEYGNYEEVLINDVQEINPTWNAGPLSFHPSHWNNPENSVNQTTQFRDSMDSRQDLNKYHNQYYGRQDRQKPRQQDYRSAAKLYQPPHQRQQS